MVLKSYVRENVIPVFISERAPARNREDLWDLLEECDMQYLNQLEWLIRTNTRYSGDKLFVQRPEDKTMEIESINLLGNRSAVICRKVLETICYGDEVISSTLTVNDKNRKQYYDLLMTLYSGSLSGTKIAVLGCYGKLFAKQISNKYID